MGQDPVPKGAATEDRKGRRAFWRSSAAGSCPPRPRGRRSQRARTATLSLEALIEHRDRLQAFVAAHRAPASFVYMVVYIARRHALDPGRGLSDHPRRLPVRLARRGRGGGGLGRPSARSGSSSSPGPRSATPLRGAPARASGASPPASGRMPFPTCCSCASCPSCRSGSPTSPRRCSACRSRTFFIATQIGVIPATFAFAVAGSGLDGIIEAQQRARQACLAAGGRDCGLEPRARERFSRPQ